MGGPDPLDAQGENKLRYNFTQAYWRFDGEVVQAYTEFLDHMFGRVQPTLKMLSSVGTGSPACDLVPVPIAMPANVTHITAYNPTSTCVVTPTLPMEAIAMPSTGVVMSSASIATPLVGRMPSNISTWLHNCDSVPMPIAMPGNVTLITTCNLTSTHIATPTATDQFHNPTLAYLTVPILGSIAMQSGDFVQAYTPTQSVVDPLLTSGTSNLVAGLPISYGDVSHPILSISDFDLLATMAFDFPPLSFFEADIGTMMYENTSLTAMGDPVQWSSGSTHKSAIAELPPIPPAISPPSIPNLLVLPLPSIQPNSPAQNNAVVEPVPRKTFSDPAQVAAPSTTTEAAMVHSKRRSIPSQCAQRDNAIGITGKESIGFLPLGKQKASLKHISKQDVSQNQSQTSP
ncbi:hypothetical protein EDD16DRAFT_1525760 [Pisolithus croceorrhizus]|nr:hypothetical protein EV401DRAFT_1895122 [Pisolithus croceorrhizus]KAI6101981.1 hypothetical protein EDD16DRAFT_1525760 [Pisolithus croceorrhizus]